MSALILVVDDVAANVKLLEAKLTNEYYNVITARDGFEALEQVRAHKPDLVLLDVMMPKMDGFETCRQLKADPDISHIPVVMVTALSDISDRVQGLEAGADDFITKPINDMALFARVRSLVRIKLLMDELRLREKTGTQIGVLGDANAFTQDVTGANILLLSDDVVESQQLKQVLSRQYNVQTMESVDILYDYINSNAETIDLLILPGHIGDIDGLRVATKLRQIEAFRHVPVIMQVDEEESSLMLKGLELGVNDYLIHPVDANELLARTKTQIRRKKYQKMLKSNYLDSVSMAVTDALTGLYNRHYLNAHMTNMLDQARSQNRPLSVMMMDMDHFKSVNDTYGHDVGDEVLVELAKRIIANVRSTDLAARIGGEEFVVLMPDTSARDALDMAERMRVYVEEKAFSAQKGEVQLSKTISIGVATYNGEQIDEPESILKRADTQLYAAKHGGRNCVCPKTVEEVNAIVTPVVSSQPEQEQVEEARPRGLLQRFGRIIQRGSVTNADNAQEDAGHVQNIQPTPPKDTGF